MTSLSVCIFLEINPRAFLAQQTSTEYQLDIILAPSQKSETIYIYKINISLAENICFHVWFYAVRNDENIYETMRWKAFFEAG